MKKNLYYAGAAIAAVAIFAASIAGAADKSGQKADPQMAEMMKKMEVAGTPAAEHKALEPLVGNWEVEAKCWMAPDAPPTITKGTAKATWVMNGRFVQEEFHGEFMGKPFRGISLTGYDNTKKKYNSVWIDDMHTSMFTSEGAADSGGKVLTFEGKMDCPMTGQKDMAMKHVVRVLNRDKHVFEMYDASKGKETKTMEITYTRK